MHEMGHVIVQIRECDAILGTNGLPNDHFVDVVELIPVVVTERDAKELEMRCTGDGRTASLPNVVVLDERLELRSAGNGHVERFRSEETLRVEQVEEIVVDQICEQLVRQPVQRGHLRQAQVPLPIRGTVYVSAEE